MHEALHRVEGFSELPLDGLARLADQGVRRSFIAGTQLIVQGDVSDRMYLILEGHVSVERAHPDMLEPLVLAELGPGDVVGEMGLLDTGPRSATVVAIDDTQALELSAAALSETVAQHPEVSGALLRILTQRLRSTNDLIEAMSRRTRRQDKPEGQ